MNGMNNSSDEGVECPLCMEPLEVDDLNFYPCTCGYQICRFCWHRIRTDENELCPACRKAYPENPADFKPLTQEQMTALKAEKRQRDQQRKQKITENRKHLANVRVVQKNLVFVVGLPPRLADADILKKHEYFGKFGKIHKVVINPSTTYAGVQGPSASAYVTYVHNNDALRAIQSVNNISIDGRQIKTSLGTTKYCSHFMKNQQCPKGDCMYLHELGDSEASFTKEEMHQCKHQEYEKRLHDALIAQTAAGGVVSTTIGSSCSSSCSTGSNSSNSNGSTTSNGESATIKISNNKAGDTKLINGSGGNGGSVQSPDAWPSLSVSPVTKEITISGSSNRKSNKENINKNESRKHEKSSKSEKSTNGKKKQQINHNKENQNTSNKDAINSVSNDSSATSVPVAVVNGKLIDNHSINENDQNKSNISPDDELKFIEYMEKECNSSEDSDTNGKSTDTRSLSSSSSTNSDSTSSLSESASGKSSPGSCFPDHQISSTNILGNGTDSILEEITAGKADSTQPEINFGLTPVTESMLNGFNIPTSDTISQSANKLNSDNSLIDTTAGLSKLNLSDYNNSFLTSSFQPLLKKLEAERTSQLHSAQLPDLLNGIDGYQNQTNNLNSTNNGSMGGVGLLNGNFDFNNLINTQNQLQCNPIDDWEQVFKYAMMRNNSNKQMEERNNLLNNMMGSGGLANKQTNGLLDFSSTQNFNGNPLDQNALSLFQFQQREMQLQQHQQQQNSFNQSENLLGANSLFGANMSKFFDFHKNQQQQQHQHFVVNGHNSNLVNHQRDHLNMSNLLDVNRMNSQFMDHNQLGQDRLQNKKFDGGLGTHHLMNQQNSSQKPQNRISSQFPQMGTPADDDLGFDPFIETQKGLAELIENEVVQQQTTQRTRMPPPGFNHMNTNNFNNGFGGGMPQRQPQHQMPPSASKILPFMNTNAPPNLQQQHPNNWNLHSLGLGGGFPQQLAQHHLNEQQIHMGVNGQQPQNQNGGNHKGMGSNSDWTAMDPAILSFRQFPSFSSQQQQPPQQQQQQSHNNMPPHFQNTPNADKFMHHLSQQQNVQPQGFGHHGANLMNQQQQQQQQNSQAQVNFSQANWLNTDLFMNSLTSNGFSNSNNNSNNSNNNFDKFSIPMPPGLTLNNINHHFNKSQQKTECIN